MASWGIAIQPLKSHILLHYSNSLFLYIDSNLSSQPISFHFPLFNTLIFTTFQNYLLCRPSPDHIAVYQFDTSSLTHPNLIGLWNISSQYKVSVACWASYDCGEESFSSNTSNNNNNNNNNDNTITSNISVALSLNSQGSTTATLPKTTPSVSSLTSTSNHSQQTDTLQDEPSKPELKNTIYALLGTRNGTVLRLDISSPGTLTPLTVLPRSPTACTTPSTPATNFIISSPSQFTNSPTTTSHSNHGTVSSIAAAPCGMGVYAIGYATGHISIVQLTSPTTETFFLRPIHEIPPMGSPRKILALSWHYSSKNFSSQSLAALRDGSDRLIVWTVDIFDNCKKIREVPLPQKHAPPSVCDNFLQWSKSGKIIRVSDSGLIISDVRTKKVVTRSVIFPALPVVCIMVRSNKGKAWAVNSQGKLQSFNLVDGGSLLESTQLPFNLKSPDTAAILDSPVVFLQNVKVGEITQVIITKSPRSSSHDDNNNSNSKHEDEQQSRPDNASSSSCIPAASFNTAGPKAPQAPPIRLCMTPIKSALASLFPSVIKNLSKMPAQRVPEFNPSQLTVEQYVLCALFGGVFNTTLCLSGIRELLYSTIDMKSNCSLSPALKRAVILLLVQKPSQQELLSSLNQFEASKELLASLLYAATVASTASNSVEEELLNQFKQALSLSSVSNGKQTASTPNKQHINYDQLHFTCAYLHSLGLSLIASQLYMSANFYLEALSICLLSSLDVVPVLRCWSAYLQKADSKSSRLKNNKGSNSSTNNLVTYLINIVANLDTGSSINTNSDANSTHSVSSGFALSNDESEYIHATISGYYRPTSGISSSSLNNNNNSNSTFDSSLTTTTTANSAYEIFDIHPSLSSSSSSPSSTSYMSNMPTPNNFHTSSAASSPMAYNSSAFTTPNANVHGFTETSSHDITDVTSKTSNTNASDSMSTVNICRSSSPKSTSSSHSKNFALSQQNTPDFSIEDNNNVMIFSPEFSSEDFSNQRSQNNGTMNSSTKNFLNSLQSSRKSNNNINNNLQQTKPVANVQMVSPNMPPSSPTLSQNSISSINQESSVSLSPSSISKRSGIIVRQQQQQHLYQPTPNSPFNPPRTPIMSDEFPTGNHSITSTPNIGSNSNGHYVEVSAPSNYPNFSRYVYSSPSGNVF